MRCLGSHVSECKHHNRLCIQVSRVQAKPLNTQVHNHISMDSLHMGSLWVIVVFMYCHYGIITLWVVEQLTRYSGHLGNIQEC